MMSAKSFELLKIQSCDGIECLVDIYLVKGEIWNIEISGVIGVNLFHL